MPNLDWIGKNAVVTHHAAVPFQLLEPVAALSCGEGHGEGYSRQARAGTPVLVNGTRAPLVGRVSMDLVTIDLRGHPDARIGDPVVLWGRGLPVEEVADHAGTISYDLTCGVTRRVRFVEEDGY